MLILFKLPQTVKTIINCYQSAQLVLHQYTEMAPIIRVCEICGMDKFLNDRKFREHCKKHLDEVVPCNKCNKKFRTKILFGYHTRDYHGEKLNCDYCGKYFATKKSFN